MAEDRLTALLRTHLDRYPAAGIGDVYKLLHQAAFGPGHLIANKKAAREWLEQEMSLIKTPQAGPLLENVHPDRVIVRLHLGPYLALGGKVKPLLEAFVRSAEQVPGDAAALAAHWAFFEAQCGPNGAWAGRFSPREVHLFGMVRAQEHWPAVHHSPAYVNAYAPRYRVLVRTEAEALARKLGAPPDVI